MSNVHYFRERMAGESWIFKEEDPNNPEWCTESQPFADWGLGRISWLEKHPTDGNIVRLTAALIDNYAERLTQAGQEHRPENNQGEHHCLHEALLVIWRKIREIKLDRELPDLAPEIIEVPVPVPEEKRASEPTRQDVKDVIAGTYGQPDEDDFV